MYTIIILIHSFRLLISSMVAADMIILHVLIVITVIHFVKSSQKLLHSDVFGITWDNAQDACKPHGLENREEYLRESGIPNEHEFWIGKAVYRVPTRWIEIIGCFQIAEIHTYSFPAVTSIGYCQHKCYSENRGSYFGYKKLIRNTKTHNCVCLPNGLDTLQQRDIQYCVNSTHFFVYRDYNGTVAISSDPGNCTTICCGYCNTITANGNNLEGRRCSSENDTIVGNCVLDTKQNSAFKWALDFSSSLNYCMKRNALLPSSNYCQHIETLKGQISWTNVFREEIKIIKVKDFDEQPQRCFSGIFIPVKGHKILNITEQECTKNKLFYLCKTNTSIDTDVKTQRPLCTLNKEQDENVNTSSDPLFTHKKDKHSYQSTGSVIGGIIAACFILAIIAALIACKIRSKGIFKESDTLEEGETSQLHFSNIINPDSTNTRNKKINELCEMGASEYFDVHLLTKSENMNDTYTDAADGEYDILHGKQNRRICPTDNVYISQGVHQNEDGPTYDSAAIVKENHNDGNGLYDTSCSVVEGEYSYMSYKSHECSISTDIYDK